MNAQATKKVTTKKSMASIKPWHRIGFLKDVGMNQKAFAKHCEVSEPMVTQFMKDERTSLYLALKLSEVTGKPLSQLWSCGKYQKAYDKTQQLMERAQ